MDTCFIYCRKSSEDKDRQILSLNDQENTCTELAQDKGFAILGVYKESKSAKRPDKRPEFKAMLARLANGEARHVICWKADRLCRNAKEGGTLIDKVDYEDLKIITPSMDYNRGNSTFLFIEFGMATKFSKDLSDNVKRGMHTKLQMGWMPGKAPLGYLNDKVKPKGQKDVQFDPQRFDLCRKWWELMISGKETVQSSLDKVTGMGLRSRSTGKKISTAEAFRFFRRIFYTGLFDYKGERYQGKQRPMITIAEFNRVQEIIDGRKKVIQNSNNFYFMKLLKCGECGSSITCEQHSKRYKNGTYQTFIYARCTKKNGNCSQPYLNAIQLEEQVREYVAGLQISPYLVDWVRDNLKRRNDKEFEFEKVQKGKLTRRLDTILTEKKNVFGMKIEGLISEEEYQSEKNRLLDEEKRIKDDIVSDGIGEWTRVMEETLAFAARLTDLFEEAKEDPEAQRMILRILGSNLELKDKIVRIDAEKVFVFFKQIEKLQSGEIDWLEPQKGLINWDKSLLPPINSHMELSARIELASQASEARTLSVELREHLLFPL